MGNPLEETDTPLAAKLRTALAKVGIAMKAQAWETASPAGINPTQGQVLALLLHSPVELRLSQIVDDLSVTAPTASASVAALERKGLVRKQRARDDQRALSLSLTAAGRQLAKRLAGPNDAVHLSLETLSPAEQTLLLRTMLKIIRTLQVQGKIPVARMCVTCRYFRPNAHRSRLRPHHCDLVGAAFGDSFLRVDCPEHEPAAEASAVENWEKFAEL